MKTRPSNETIDFELSFSNSSEINRKYGKRSQSIVPVKLIIKQTDIEHTENEKIIEIKQNGGRKKRFDLHQLVELIKLMGNAGR